MKSTALILLAFFAVACDPYGFGFKKNPAYVLYNILKSVQNLDEVTFLEFSGREALCLYGDQDGINYLNSNLKFLAQDVELKEQKTSEMQFLTSPQYVGFWAYLKQRHVINLKHKSSSDLLGTVVVDCHYGMSGEKRSEYLQIRNPKKFKQKECVLIKIVPSQFAALPMDHQCKKLAVNL